MDWFIVILKKTKMMRMMMTEFLKKSFTVPMQGDSDYRDNWERTFGAKKKPINDLDDIDEIEFPLTKKDLPLQVERTNDFFSGEKPKMMIPPPKEGNIVLEARCNERLKKIQDTNEIGYYAKMYAEDVILLLSELIELRRTIEKIKIISIEKYNPTQISSVGWWCTCGIFNDETEGSRNDCRGCKQTKIVR